MIDRLVAKILQNKFVAICILFTIFTISDTLTVLFNLYPPKSGWDLYVHLLGRFVLMSALVFSLYIFKLIQKRLKSKLYAYLLTYVITWAFLFCYLKLNGLFTELHPDAVYYMTISYTFLYLLLGAVVFVIALVKKRQTP